MIKNNKIIVNISYRNVTHYMKLGYNAIINKSLEIKTTDLPTVSHVKIESICQLCGGINKIMYCKYITNINRYGFYGCRGCSREKFRMTYLKREGDHSYIDMNREQLMKALNKESDDIHMKSEDNYIEISGDTYLLYRNEVRRLTKKVESILYGNWNGFDYYDNEFIKENFNLNHNDPKFPTIDHKTSVYYGFINKIPPSEIADISNLYITKRSINSTKREFNEFKS